MMEKRKAFNFYRSYYEVAKTLPKRDQLSFIMAILDKQFCNIDTELSGKALNAYIGQKHSIEAQVGGFIAKQSNTPSVPPSVPPSVGGSQPPSVQGKGEEQGEEKGEGQGKEKYSNEWSEFWDTYGKKVDTKKCKEKFQRLKPDEVSAILAHVPKYVKATPDVKYRKNPLTYLNGRGWEDEIVQPPPFNDWKPFQRSPFGW
jgi:hypothetical protein